MALCSSGPSWLLHAHLRMCPIHLSALHSCLLEGRGACPRLFPAPSGMALEVSHPIFSPTPWSRWTWAGLLRAWPLDVGPRPHSQSSWTGRPWTVGSQGPHGPAERGCWKKEETQRQQSRESVASEPWKRKFGSSFYLVLTPERLSRFPLSCGPRPSLLYFRVLYEDCSPRSWTSQHTFYAFSVYSSAFSWGEGRGHAGDDFSEAILNQMPQAQSWYRRAF